MSLTRVTINLTPRAATILDRLTDLTGTNKTDLINRAVGILDLVETLLDENGGHLTIKRKDGTEDRLFIL